MILIYVKQDIKNVYVGLLIVEDIWEFLQNKIKKN